MPKKFTGVNTKAAASREKQKQLKEEKSKEENKLHDDEQWKENDKQTQKKQAKKEAQEKKRQEAKQKKMEITAQLEEEMAAIKSNKNMKASNKPKRYEIRKSLELQKSKIENPKCLETPLEENLNKLLIEEDIGRNIDEAISIFSEKEQIDKHPEKRIKAAHKRFEEKRLKELKAENPTLKLSQLKDIVFKEWKSSPENPLVQKSIN